MSRDSTSPTAEHAAPIAAAHPLDPLGPAELTRAVALGRALPELSARVRIVFCDLREPDKAALAAWYGGGARPAREAFLVLLDNADGRTHEVRVDLDANAIASAVEVPGVQPAVTLDEFDEAGVAARSDPRYREALARRGIDDPERVMIDAWSLGVHEDPARRLVRGLAWLKTDDTGDNFYARPLGGLVVVVDLNAMEVVRVDDHGALPVPDGEGGDYRDGGGASPRDDLRPLEITQPEGPSFTVEGYELRWQHWRLRVGFTMREGLVLHEVGYEDGGRVRPIMHRASLAELAVPYGDPNPTVHFKNAFDVGEYGIGPLLNSLERGCDCLGEIRYLDLASVDSRGRLLELTNAVCVHEEDVGIGWKHYDYRSGRIDIVRLRRLVVSAIATVGNYEYGMYWYLYTDGQIGFEAKLTGVLHTAGVAAGVEQAHATPLAPGVVGSYHQHFFCMRLDLDVDGAANSVYEVDAARAPAGPDNPDGIAFVSVRTPLASESQAKRSSDAAVARRWRIENPSVANRIGASVAFELVPAATVAPMQWPESSVRRRAAFLDHHLWVTPYRPDERFPAGEYPNQHAGGDGLPRWTAADRPLADTDVVLWYVFGEHHVPRLEDWPVMPVVPLGFMLRPVGFFDRNPALDMPQPAHCAHER